MYKQETITPYGNGESKSKQVEKMFDNISTCYDAYNHRLSWGIDRRWRRKAIEQLAAFNPRYILDIATGTGDFAIETAKTIHPDGLVATDISEGMMAQGRDKVRQEGLDGIIEFKRDDCMKLSFADETFDAATSAFGIRNFQDLDKGLKEICRVLRKGGHACLVELSCPAKSPARQLFHAYSHTVMPLFGRLMSHDTAAYTYLTASIEAFPQGEEMVAALRGAGFSDAKFKRMTMGICSYYIATK